MKEETLQDIKRQIDEAKVQEFNVEEDPQFKQSDGTVFGETPEIPAVEQEIKAEPSKKEEQDWKLLYGRSENEKGDLRRRLEEAERRAGEYERMVSSAPAPQQTHQQNIDFFMNMKDDDFYDPQKVRQAWNNALIMLGSVAQAQIDAVKYRASIKDWDVTPEEEREIRMESSRFINQMTPEAQDAYIYEKAKTKRMLREKPEIDRVKEQQAKLSQLTANRAFVESSSESAREEPTSALDALWQKFDSGEIDSAQMKKELKRHGLYKIEGLRRRT